MAKFRNSRSGDVITVAGPLVEMYQRKAHWRRLPTPKAKEPEDKNPEGQASKDPKNTTKKRASTRRRG